MTAIRLAIQPVMLLSLVLCCPVGGQDAGRAGMMLYVPGDYTTIQDAIDAAVDGDVVEIAAGHYTGPGNRDIDFGGKAITVRGSRHSGQTVIVCQDANTASGRPHRGFYFHSGETPRSILRNVTIERGHAPEPNDPALTSLSDMLTARSMGGGICCENSSPTFINVQVRQCRARVGGGIACVGGNPALINCVIEACTAGESVNALTGGKGGGIALMEGARVQMNQSILRNNMAGHDGYGAGIYLQNSTAVIQHSDISGNTATGDSLGGAVFVASHTAEANADFIRSRSQVRFRHCLITENAAHRGAAIFVQGRSSADEAVPDSDAVHSVPALSMINTTVAANRLWDQIPADDEDLARAAVEVRGQTVEIRNSILWHNDGNALWLEPASRAWVSFCNVQGGFAGPGNIHRDPLFADLPGGDFHLKSRTGRWDSAGHTWTMDPVHSPCIDRGHPDDAVGEESEPHGGRINMGAYGGSSEASRGMEQRRIWHVDSGEGSETNPGLVPDRAFSRIQTAVDTAREGDTVLIWPGTYIEREGIVLRGKAITIQGALGAPLIKTPGDHAFSFYAQEGHDSVLRNLIISSSAYAVFCSGASPTLQNLTIVHNDFGVVATEGSDPVILNCIVWGNQRGDLFCDSLRPCRVDYSCIERIEQSMGMGNISADPLFVDPVHDDFHLRSQQGRYWPEADQWVQDDVTSPCIDAGHPTLSPVHEPGPNGARLNMGAYGGTDQASLSFWPIVTDNSGNRTGKPVTGVALDGITGSSEDRP